MNGSILIEHVVYNKENEGFISVANMNAIKYSSLRECKGNNEKIADIMIGINSFYHSKCSAEYSSKSNYVVLQVVDGRVIPHLSVDQTSNYRELTEYEDCSYGLW